MHPKLVRELRIEVFHEGEFVYRGRWQDAPTAVRNYIAAAEGHYGSEALRDYLVTKSAPLSLLYRGYTFRVV